MRTIGALAVLCLLCGCGLLTQYDDGNGMVEAVRTRLDRVAPQAGGSEDAALRRFYEQRKFQPAWSDQRAGAAIGALMRAGTHGLDPALYHAGDLADRRARLRDDTSPAERAAFDVDLTRALLQFAHHLESGQVAPTKDKGADPVPALQRAAEGNPSEELEAMAPSSPEYTSLRHELARLHGIAAAGGWGRVPPGAALAPGASGSRVLALRHRLAADGSIPVEEASLPRFDASLEDAVRRFQRAHGVDTTGRVDDATLAELNVPVQDRITTVVLNLERWRWMPRAPALALVVNIPAFELQLKDRDRPTLTSRIVVGKSWSPTPIFNDAITSVVLNPVWNVPESITRDEIVPAVRRDPGYLARNGMRIFRGEEEVDPSSVDWSGEVEQLSVRQDPGDQNALGKIKFLMPNKYDVYLHDTPAGHLFAREERAFSHGCIRVERPLDLATSLLADQTDWPTSRLEEVIASGKTTEIQLSHSVPVQITYFTAWAAPSGEIRYGPDVYGLDRELAAALKGRRPDATIAHKLLPSQQSSLVPPQPQQEDPPHGPERPS